MHVGPRRLHKWLQPYEVYSNSRVVFISRINSVYVYHSYEKQQQ